MNRLLAFALLVGCGPSKSVQAPPASPEASQSQVAAAQPSTADRDGDGIADSVDECPDVAESKNQIDDADGCPEVDIDRDGIVGTADKCPSDPEDKDGFEDTDGCPDVDGDKDGVADENDMCPEEMETINAYKDSDGCADVIPPSLQEYLGTITAIRFGSGSSRLLASSKPTLSKAAKVFKKHPDARIEIQGHTDDDGAREPNVKLSQKRAESVRAYLIKKGAPGANLIARGYGPDQPKVKNTDKASRAINRRVDFKLISDVAP